MDDKLLHSPNMVVIGLSMWYETWRPIGWHHPFAIGSFKYRLGLPKAPLWLAGIPTVFQTPVTVPLHSLHSASGRQMPAVRVVQGDCERVYGDDDCLQVQIATNTLSTEP